jgi:tripartite-type tricarboxylate transporter receptor subunit TctC
MLLDPSRQCRQRVRALKMAVAAMALASLTLAPAAAQTSSQSVAQPPMIRILSGYAPGGGGDVTARALAEALQAKLGTTVIVENKPGAGGNLASQALKVAPADGSVYMLASDQAYIAPITMKTAGYDPVRDFTVVAGINTFDLCLGVATPSVSATSMTQWLALAGRDPKMASYGVPAPGSLPQFFGYVMGKQAGVALNPVAYKGAAPMVVDLAAGHVPAAIGPCRDMATQRQAGNVRLLAAVQKLPYASDVPTFAEVGLSMLRPNWLGLFAPAGVLPARRQAVESAVRELLQDEAFRDRLIKAGFTPRFASGRELAAQGEEAAAYWAVQIRESGFKAE